MYVIEHKGEKTADSKSEEHHKGIDETKPHFHLLVKFEKKQATLEEIAKYIGVRLEIIEKPKSGGYSYLIHIKDEDKIQYKEEYVVTLAGTDYRDYYNKYRKSWENGREHKAKKGGKPIDRLCREAINKLESGELSYAELFGIPEYHDLLLKGKYQPKLKAAAKRAEETAGYDFCRLCDKIYNGEISKEEAKTLKEYKYVFKYYKESDIDSRISSIKSGLIQRL